ncbi:hypothetical protein AMAG_01052 [Allomyces macrogynus ATCC 38327]|uniref:Uncharacterized protein n=1 Tax=Allomyces macrogynus (strain ATCC 38327) TaxID=578462 RepID=A0A0L0RYI5_ALLM3|nr:hypothetical protein AMAG_01052 [Allomyces macrogynus ATCC 38327]|eukprot:KNE55121.1 hypothetical protein AMAG_01052 [Allomyces macrogynus ATCC 38327]
MASPSVQSSSSSMARAHQFMSFTTDFSVSERGSRAPSVRGQGASAFLLPPPAAFVPMVVHGPEPESDPLRRLDPVLAPPDHDTDSDPTSATSSDLDVGDLAEPIMSVPDGTKPILPDNVVGNDKTPDPRAVQWTTSRRREPPPGPPISGFPTDDDYVIPAH